MTDEGTQALAGIRAVIEARVREQVERHVRVDRSVDPRKIVDIQMEQEREKLERAIEKKEDDPDAVAVYEALIDWLPELAAQLKSR